MSFLLLGYSENFDTMPSTQTLLSFHAYTDEVELRFAVETNLVSTSALAIWRQLRVLSGALTGSAFLNLSVSSRTNSCYGLRERIIGEEAIECFKSFH